MNKNFRNAVLVAAIGGALLTTGCATRIKASSAQNPPPKEAFATYGRIEIKPVVFKAGYVGDASGLAKIDENFRADLAESLARWNQRPVNGRTLVIEPVIDELSFKHGAKRVLLGPLAGSSGVLMHVSIHDASGAVVANPEFFQRADAMGAGFTFGAHDNLMLTRVGKLAAGYVMANYDTPVGGPTGADDKAVAR
ncbi:hypothetical protein D0T25_26410 [Duganella sp. BJB488]|uniref:hypothetical protein n=1 Tax=unclassified Duganella TaxID=2636909 RepID=UPI000E342D06|nr:MULTISPECIES: hypothetical protein [unclassified Duganella]RFP11602.1 hypothetical protein D0T26_24870 [Duganella sp. BJB489]RFP15684.1 hypothetical protein D0T25_26410 [Duganella sp. BJB488]RFP30631.1 hypothetical protein D0T24_27110 [Duganella sp. BJB480]